MILGHTLAIGNAPKTNSLPVWSPEIWFSHPHLMVKNWRNSMNRHCCDTAMKIGPSRCIDIPKDIYEGYMIPKDVT